MLNNMIPLRVITVLLISLIPLIAVSKQDTAEAVKGNITPDIFNKREVMEFNVVKDLSTIEFVGSSFTNRFRGITHEIEGFTKGSFYNAKEAKCEISIPVKTVYGVAFGGKRGKLTNDIQTTLESDKYPYITFKMQQALPTKVDLKAAKANFLVKGDLTIHGITRNILFPVNVEIKNGFLHFTGEYNNLYVRDYGIEPKPLMGFIKVRDTVDVKFDIYEALRRDKTSE